MDWFVVRTKARQELRAIHHLEEQGFKVYCPQIPKYNGSKRSGWEASFVSRATVSFKAGSCQLRAFGQRLA